MKNIKNNKNIKGITLIEILISIVISTLMMAAMFTSYNVVNGSYSQIIDKANISNSSRVFVEMITKEIRMAGFKYFDDNKLTNTNNIFDIPIEIQKDPANTCCDKLIIIYGDFDEKKIGDEKFIRYKITYEGQQQQEIKNGLKVNIVGIYEIIKTKEKWVNGQWVEGDRNLLRDDTLYSKEVVASYVSDIEFTAIDKLGIRITPPPSYTNVNKDKIYSIYNVEMFLTFRSKKDFFRDSKKRTISSTHDELRDQKNTDKFLRDSMTITTFTRNLEVYR